jgi:redox-sensing transcriptional repressor
VISVPAGISVRKVDLAVELQILSYYEQRRATAPPPPDCVPCPASVNVARAA